MEHLTRAVEVDAAIADAFGWHERPGALERLTPPWEDVTVERPPASLAVGTQVVLRTTALALGRVRWAPRWVAEHVDLDPPHSFRDVQRRGPFGVFDHTHRFTDLGSGRTRVTDDLRYALPLAGLTQPLAGRWVRRRLGRLLDYRHRVTVADVEAHLRARARGVRTMKIAVTGASGLIGAQLVPFLTGGGHEVRRLVRRAPTGPDEVRWDPEGAVDPELLRDVDAVIHLAGEGIGDHRWTEEHKRRVLESRTHSTRGLAEALARLDDRPRAFIVASAIGYYGADRGDEVLTETSSSGEGFLADLVRQWEAAADPARDAGLRVVHVRSGIVQSPRGGSLKLQLPLFKAGLGGRLGSGKQYVSWITIDDEVGLFAHALTTTEVSGPMNATAPEPVTNGQFTKVLAKVLGRPAVIPTPSFGPALLLGPEGARETAFASQRVLPGVAERTGYAFRHRDLEAGLRHVLGRAA